MLTTAKIILAMFLWAICFPLITIGIAYAPHLTFATMRAAMAGLVLLGLALVLRKPLPRDRKSWATLIVIGFGATSMGYFGMFHAAEFVSPGIATVIANTQPLLAAGLASVVLGERLTVTGKSGLAIGFLGIVVIAAPQLFASDQESYAVGVSYIILAALGITVSNVMLKQIADTVDPLMAVGLQLLIGSIPLAVIAVMTEDITLIQWSAGFVLAWLGLALFGSALVYVIWMSVLAEVPLSRANAFSFLVPVFGLTIGFLYYGEALGWPERTGIVLALVGVTMVTQKGVVHSTPVSVAK
jgi:drug/metabolite transporter (DMT)-like permease